MSREDDARQVLNNAAFQAAFAELKEQLTTEWLQTAPEEIDRRETLHLSIKLTDRIHSHFESILETGTITNHYRN